MQQNESQSYTICILNLIHLYVFCSCRTVEMLPKTNSTVFMLPVDICTLPMTSGDECMRQRIIAL